MKNPSVHRFRPLMERLEEREVPAFLAPISSPGGGDSVAVGDLNLDGRDDVATVRGKNVRISLSNGDGTLRLTNTLGANSKIVSVGVWDINGDGKLDVRAASVKRNGSGWNGSDRYDVYINVWLGDGTGSFGPRTTTFFGLGGSDGTVYNPRSTSADFDGDGVQDLALLNTINNTVVLQLGNPDGTYQPARTFAAGLSPGSIAVGDFNGDGWTDIVVVNNLSSNSPTLSVLLNDWIW